MNSPSFRPAEASARLWLALVVALVASAGSIWLSMQMQLKACPLCLYQRAGVLATAAVLVMGMLLRRQDAAAIAVLALGPAIGAWGVAMFHVYLERSGTLECPLGIGGIGTAPQQAFLIESLLVVTLGIATWPRFVSAVLAVGVGAVLTVFMVRGAPPLPPAPKLPYPPNEKFDMCRPPFVSTADRPAAP